MRESYTKSFCGSVCAMKIRNKCSILLLGVLLLFGVVFLPAFAEETPGSESLRPFETTDDAATIIYVGRDGEELSRATCDIGLFLSAPQYESGYREGDGAFAHVGWTAHIDGQEISDATVVTEEMIGKTVTMTPKYERATFTTEGTDGITYYTGSEYSDFQSVVNDMEEAGKITLFADFCDFEDGTGEYLKLTKEGTELDLNGHTLATEEAYGSQHFFLLVSAKAYIYSSAPGARIFAGCREAQTGCDYIFCALAETVVGRGPDGTVCDAGNLMLEGPSLLLHRVAGKTVVFDGIDYSNTRMNKKGVIAYYAKGGNVQILNSTLWLLTDNSVLFAPRSNDAGATVTNSFLYTEADTLAAPDSFVARVESVGAMITDSVICSTCTLTSDENFTVRLGSGVKTNQANDFPTEEGSIFAHTDTHELTRGEKDFGLLYETLPVENTVTVTITDGEKELVKEAWKKGSVPHYRSELFGTYYRYTESETPAEEDLTLRTTVRTTQPKITGNLTLYANITFNLYFRADGFIKGVTYFHPETKEATTVDFDGQTTFTLNGAEYYLFRISDIAPKDLVDAFTLEVLLENGEESAIYKVGTSLSKYAEKVLEDSAEDEKTRAGKTLVLSLLDYVREVSVALGGKPISEEGVHAIDAGLWYYRYTRREWSGSAEIPSAGNVKGAALHLVSDPGFVFFLSKDYAGRESVTASVNGVTREYSVTHEGDTSYFIVNRIHISSYNDDISVVLDGQSFVYNLGVYMAGFGEEIPDYANALYSYSLAAKAYLATTES